MSVARRPAIAVGAAALALALLIAAPQGTASSREPPESVAASEPGVDPAIRPGDDFFAYANGAWLHSTQIPAGKQRWGARNEIDEKTRAQLAGLIEVSAWPPGSYQRQAADFHAAYLADGVIEAKGIAPIEPMLTEIRHVHDKAALARLLGSSLRADVDPLNFGIYESPNLFGLAVQRGIHGEKGHFAFLVQGGLSLADRDQYLASTQSTGELRVRHQAAIARALQLAGFDRASQRAAGVMKLETAIARVHATREESSNESNADHHWSRADFFERAPGLDWSAFLAAARLSKQADFIAWQPGAITGEAALVASFPLETWKNYLRFHVIDRYAEVLPRAFRELEPALHGLDAPSAPAQLTREQNALDATSRVLPDAVGRMYVERYFSAEQKLKVRSIVVDVIAAFGRRIEAAAWMSPATKAQAKSKLDAMYFGVGFPERWADYSQLSIAADDAVGNFRRAADWNYHRALDALDQPADATEWVMPPQTAAAFFLPLQNAYNFSAALLQPPKFDPEASDAANYGAIGAIVGHEVSHFVDLLGADYDAQGAKHHWWTTEDKERFETASEPLVRQFSGYRPFPDLAVDGKLTLSENIADLAGVTASFDAYRHTLGEKAIDENYVRRQDREFFIAFARAWRVKMRDDALRAQLSANDHAPENFRVSTVRNLDAWYDAFDVLPGQALYLGPAARVRIW